MKKLTRTNEKLVAGVVGGISNYVNPEMDPVFFRLAFALLTIFNPLVIFIYFGMALILPTENISYSK
jgi:phage shock protein PspC (stress-responsive transcriptional regulator)